MKRTPLARKSPLSRSAPMRRRRPVRKRNTKRLKRLRAKQFGPQAALARSMPCCACGAPPPSDPHHFRARGFGGVKSDDSQCLALCRVCHDRVHSLGARFWDIVRVDPHDVLNRMHTLVRDSEHEGLAVSPWLAWLE